MTQNDTTSDRTAWDFTDKKRWIITVILKTITPLHIGSGEKREITITNSQGKEEPVEANGFLTDSSTVGPEKPIIPGSTLKGKLLACIKGAVADKDLIKKVFGQPHSSEHDQGGVAEFHDAVLENKCSNGKSYPHWDEDRQIFLEASIAMDRHTRTALDGHLRYTECVAPDTQFKVIVTGDMTDQEAALIIKALQIFQNEDNALYLGAGTANGKGRMMAVGSVVVELLDHPAVINWLASIEAENTQKFSDKTFRKLEAAEITSLVAALPLIDLQKNNNQNQFAVTLKFDGPFIVSDPTGELCEGEDGQELSNIQQPLINHKNEPIFPATSFRGAIRSQAERIIRTLGSHCCDPANPCRKEKVEKLCLACQLFGATGWKSTLHLEPFSYVESLPRAQQQFVAIDRFHGGGKDSALFSACYFEDPVFTGTITLDVRRMDEEELAWRRGFLALLFRDMQEGDITFGFGRNKGYGGLKEVVIDGQEISDKDIEAFHSRRREAATTDLCTSVSIPDTTTAPPQVAATPAPETANRFHNPYHFIPVASPDVSKWLDKSMITDKRLQSPHSHAWYRGTTDTSTTMHHGRIICKLTAETPFFVGKGNASDNPKEGAKLKAPYRLNNELAVPATSLRGLISSLAEAASNSSLRVLDDGVLTYRKPMNSKRLLSAIGIVSKRGNDFYLIPLAMPTLTRPRNADRYQLDNNDYNYQRMFPDGQAKLKVYLDSGYSVGEMKTFLENEETWTLQNNKIFYLPLKPHTLENGKLADDVSLRKPSRSNNFVIGRRCDSGNGVPSSKKKPGLTPGILRILGKEHRYKDIPSTKKHELFIPVSEEFVRDTEQYLQTAKAFPIPAEVIKKFEKIADIQTASQKQEDIDCDEKRLPFHLKGTEREENYTLKIKHGDLVYFRPDRNGDHVGEISFSSIWRDMAADSVYDFLPHTELQPFNHLRKKVSPAELLFGFVELDEDEADRPHSLAFAGKVRLTAARLSPESLAKEETELLGEEVTLKALSTPKLPSPALYFTRKNGNPGYIPKDKLGAGSAKLQGRKIYLHALRSEEDSSKVQKISVQGTKKNNGKYPWCSQNLTPERDKLKVRIQPLNKGTSFYFSVEFDNLTDWELGLLCYALRPDDSFRHKLGMGKPLGLGSVEIDIAALQTIDRGQRYKTGPTEEVRYNQINWVNDSCKDELEQTHFSAGLSNTEGNSGTVSPPEQLRKIFVKTMSPGIKQAIELLGNPKNVRYLVHYPQMAGTDIENENFKWFVENDSNRDQVLIPVEYSTEMVPTLERH